MAEHQRGDRKAFEGQLLRLLAQNVQDYAIFVVDPDGLVRTWNDGAERLLGYEEDEILGKSADCIFTPEDIQGGVPRQEMQEALQTGRGVDDRWHVRKDGSRFWASGMLTALWDEAGNLQGFAKIMRDRTEWWNAEQARQESEERASLLMDSTGEGIYGIDPEGRCTFCNPACLRLLGYERPEDLLGRKIHAVVHHGPADRMPDPEQESRIDQAICRGEGTHFDDELLWRSDGTAFPAECRSYPIRRGGQVVGGIVTFTDVTERKRAEARIAEQVRLAEYGRDVGLALTGGGTLADMLTRCVEATVRHLDGAFARIWTADEIGETLELRASAGMYTHTDGSHARVFVGQYKIGQIAQEQRPHLTNSVIGDPRIPAQDWAAREGMVAFAGYPLVVEGRLVGVLAMFARHELSAATLQAMASVADGIAVGIDRKRGEERLQREKEWLRVTLASIGDAVIATDLEGRVTFLNGVAEALTGWEQHEAASLPLGEVFRIVNEQTGREVESPALRALRDGAVVGLANHTVLIAKDGTERAIDDSAAPIRDETGAVVGAVLIFRDVAQRRRAERALEESEARKAAILQTALDAIITIDQEGNVVEWNRAAERTFGYQQAEVLGRELCGLIIPTTLREAHRRGMAHYLETGEGPVLGKRIEITGLRADGTEFPLELAITRISTDGPAVFTAHVRDITERKGVEKDLRDSEERFRAFMEQAPFSVQLFAPDGRTLRVNRAWEQLWGVTLEQIADDNILEDPQLEARGVLDHIRRAFAGEAVAVPAIRYTPNEPITKRTWNKDPRRWVSAVAYPLKDATGQIREVVLIHEDITARKEAEEALQAAHRELEARVAERTAQLSGANQFLKALLDNVQDGIVACDAEGTLTLFNRATREFHGLPPEPLSADRWAEHYDLFGADGTTRLTKEQVPLFRALRGERVRGVEMVIAPKHGPARTMLVSGQAFRDESGKRLGAVVSMHDITARKEAEEALQAAHDGLELRVAERTAELRRANEALREADRRKGELLDSLRDSEERFRTMAESIPQLAWMARPDGHIYWYNKRWHDYTGTTPEEMEGWGWQLVHDPDVLPNVMERWKRSIASGEPFDMVFPLKGADSQFRPFLTRVMPVRGEDDKVAHWFGTNTDISDRLRIEDELKVAKEEAEAANRAKTQFLAVLSHELRTPLNPILLATSAMLERPCEPEEVRPTLEMIRQNVNLQARLIDDLLDVMRIVQGKMPLHWEVADCHRVIAQAIQICQSEVSGHDLRLLVETFARHHHVNADAARLQQVLWNLIKNAVKFTPDGGTITVRTRDEADPGGSGGRIVIEVSDTGIGIEPDVLPTIWDPFQQGETTITRRFGGLGLGLAICKGVVDAHGGSLEAESEGRDQGTTFRVVLKALPEQASEFSGEPVEGVPEADLGLASSLRILIVEDEPATLRLMARLLSGLGHAVTTAGTIASAYEVFSAGEFDLIVSDVGLPDGTGLDLMRQVVALRGRVPSIALTGYGMEDDIVRSREAGFTAHMTKPIDFARLEAMIRQVAT